MSRKRYRYAIIGTGLPHGTPGATGAGMAHYHYPAFQATDRVELVALADIKDAPAQFFREKHETDAKQYRDYHEMLAKEKPDIVSITTWPHLHAEMSVAAAEAGVRVIHCEKPMAITWGDCRRMKAAADAHGAKLSFGHQRRHIRLFQAVRQAVRDGDIGDLVMVEAQCGNMYDWGTHWLDMMFFYNDETPVEWVIGQIDSRKENRVFGAFMENQGICHFKWQNGVRGLMVTGHEAKIGCVHRLIGTEGVLEVLSERKYRRLGKGEGEWKEVEVPQGDLNEHKLSAADIVRQLDEPGHTSLLSADCAIQSTEIIFATYLSSKLRARIDLPLTAEGNALLDLLEAGEIGPSRHS
jgi:predicted dehydrogenase